MCPQVSGVCACNIRQGKVRKVVNVCVRTTQADTAPIAFEFGSIAIVAIGAIGVDSEVIYLKVTRNCRILNS
jgi:hypothetical protein